MKKYHAHRIFRIQFITPDFTFKELSDRLKDEDVIAKEDAKAILVELKELELELKYLNLNFTLKFLNDLQKKLSSLNPTTFSQFCQEIRVLSCRIDDELEELVFGFISKEKGKFFDNEECFGKEVFVAFPNAREEIKEACNCFAMNLNTACVFHLMRASEIAIKEMYILMAKRKTLIYGKDKTGKMLSKPIELCDWKTLITGLNLALDKLEKGKSRSLAKHKAHSFYSEAILLFKNLKDGWRNTISHGHEINHEKERKLFKEGETEDIIRDTKRFMQRIAMKIL